MKCKRLGLGLALALCYALAQPASAQRSNDDQVAQYANAGQQALAQGHFAEAQANFEKLVKLEPEVAEIHATLGAIYFEEHEYESAVKEVQTAQKLNPRLPRLDNLLGLSLSELNRYPEALPRLEKCFKQTSDADAKRMCGLELLRTYTSLGRDADAVETSLALNKSYPDDPEVLYHTGRIYGNYAYVTMLKLHDDAPNSVWMLQAQGDANESQKDYDAAIIAYNHVLAIDPRRPGIHYRIGRVFLARFNETQKSDDREAAIREFQSELAVDPGNGNSAYEIANLHANAGNLDEARTDYEQVLARYPDFEEALVGLSAVDLQSQKPTDAVALLNRATRLRPDDEVAWYRLAQAERATGDRDGQTKALEAFRKLHSSTPATLRRPDAADEVTPQQIGTDANPQ